MRRSPPRRSALPRPARRVFLAPALAGGALVAVLLPAALLPGALLSGWPGWGGLLRGAAADVVTTKGGLVYEGPAVRLEGGAVRVTTDAGPVLVGPEELLEVKAGDGPRTTWRRSLAAAKPADAAAWYRLALEAEALGLTDEAREACAQVLLLDADHLAARRALGHERVEGAWMSADEARRRRGLVLYGGAWLLPAEVEAAQTAARAADGAPTAPRPSSDDARLKGLLRLVAAPDAAKAAAARRALGAATTKDLVAAALGLLGDADAGLRATCCRLLGEWGDESALRALVFHGARDTDAGVRREAVLAAQSFGNDDTAVPFVRALASSSVQLAANAAQALALLGDQRALGYIVKRLESHGSSTRNFVAFMNQVSYVRDYDVEIAQASNIANPNIGMIQEGVVLDVKVSGASYTETWIEPLLVDALSHLAGERFANAAQAREWYAAHRATLPDFPQKPAARAPRRGAGKVIGAR